MRFWEIDFLRGIAVVMMVIFHTIFDLSYFCGYSIPTDSGFWFWFARVTAALFIMIAGVSFTISISRTSEKDRFTKVLVRSLGMLGLSLFVTMVTYILFPSSAIYFGILHFITLSLLIAFPVFRLSWQNVILGMAILIIGIIMQGVTVDTPYLLWLGLKPHDFYTFDYVPIFPWFGIFLIGVAVGKILYAKGARTYALPDLSTNRFVSSLSFLGRNSLAIYFVHQPVILFLLILLGFHVYIFM